MIEPSKYKTVREFGPTIEVSLYDEFLIGETEYEVFDYNYDYDIAKLRSVRKSIVPNENYERELKKYNQWLKEEEKQAEQQQINTEKWERETLKRLFEKYKGSLEDIING